MVEHLVGYTKRDLVVPQDLADPATGNLAAVGWCAEVNSVVHSEICAVPAQWLEFERELLAALPSLRPRLGRATTALVAADGGIRIVEPGTGELVAEHLLVAPGETSILDEHYGSARPDRPRRSPRPRTQVERDFCALGPVAEAFITGAAAAGISNLATELADILTVERSYGREALLGAMSRRSRSGGGVARTSVRSWPPAPA